MKRKPVQRQYKRRAGRDVPWTDLAAMFAAQRRTNREDAGRAQREPAVPMDSTPVA